MHQQTVTNKTSGKFISKNNERFYLIENMDEMAPFFISVVSNSDHWLFVSTTGGLTAGRVSPETPLFPYETVDKIHDSYLNTGCKTLIRISSNEQSLVVWEPFNKEHNGRFKVTRNVYKNVLGNKLCFEEINHDLKLAYSYTWCTSDKFGFVRNCQLDNLASENRNIEIVDGMQNILPAGTPRYTQTNSSNLVDAYKWTELDEVSRLAYFTLYSGITDRAEPCESLKANTVFSLGLTEVKTLLSNEQIDGFKKGHKIAQETLKRGIRGAYFINSLLRLDANSSQTWQFVANVEMTQQAVVSLQQQLKQPDVVAQAIATSIESGSDALARIMASADGFQLTAEENVTAHHYANVLFNVLRGGIFDDQYNINSQDFVKTIAIFNQPVYQQHQAFLAALPKTIAFAQLSQLILNQNDLQLTRLASEYLPISFGRRHGDPSRPWNQFAIKLVDENNKRLLSYQGNWRDIFQNWEALTFSYPEFIESVIAKFVNASTVDGYNPYRITKEGIDWEVEEPDDPWSYIGYWGDHQIIYLQKLLELSQQFHPEKLTELYHLPIFSYANVPYRIKAFADMVENAKSTVTYDNELAERIEQRVSEIGADGKLLLDGNGQVYQVNLIEKLLVAMLCKLGNFVVDGGIWLNTQRPEWNDANNALVGQGLSMVTLGYLRRYIAFLQGQLTSQQGTVELSTEVNTWLGRTSEIFSALAQQLENNTLTGQQKYQVTENLGRAASDYRAAIYQQESFSGKQARALDDIQLLLSNALVAIDASIKNNERQDKLFNAYNLVEFDEHSLAVDELYPMLEGQVSALSAGYLSAKQTVSVLETLFSSDVYRDDQATFMLYPDRNLPKFLEKNCIAGEQARDIPLLTQLLAQDQQSIIIEDEQGQLRFNGNINNKEDLAKALNNLPVNYKDEINHASTEIQQLYENVFNHKAFTGRSGGMFGFEGLGSIYWHMVTKLLLAVEENFFTAIDNNADAADISALANWYYRIRQGIGFNKTPQEYGAFPMDPYSHTPKHAGAQQPGMTGQVKEEVLTRFAELGLRVNDGQVAFKPYLLRACEFTKEPAIFTYLDVTQQWQSLNIPANSLAFTWCQVPIIYQLTNNQTMDITVTGAEPASYSSDTLSPTMSKKLFTRSGEIKSITVTFNKNILFAG